MAIDLDKVVKQFHAAMHSTRVYHHQARREENELLCDGARENVQGTRHQSLGSLFHSSSGGLTCTLVRSSATWVFGKTPLASSISGVRSSYLLLK